MGGASTSAVPGCQYDVHEVGECRGIDEVMGIVSLAKKAHGPRHKVTSFVWVVDERQTVLDSPGPEDYCQHEYQDQAHVPAVQPKDPNGGRLRLISRRNCSERLFARRYPQDHRHAPGS